MRETIQICKQTLIFEIYPGVFASHGLDFGSRLLLKHLTNLDKPEMILDLGCGCGVLGISLAACHPESKVFMVDSDIRAVRNSRHNAQLNQIKNVEISISDWKDNLSKELLFDLIISNPPTHQGREVLNKFIVDSNQLLKPGGQLMIVMNRMTSMLKRLKEEFGNAEKIAKKKGYIVIRAIKQ